MKFQSTRSISPVLRLVICAALMMLAVGSFAAPVATHESTQLSDNGTAMRDVIVAANASQRTRAAASTLADYLGRISGAKFAVQTGDGISGIAVGVASDFPSLDLQTSFSPSEPLRHEEFLLRSHDQGVLLVGATELAVENAIWKLLDRLGYRQFFPGRNLGSRAESSVSAHRC